MWLTTNTEVINYLYTGPGVTGPYDFCRTVEVQEGGGDQL